MLKDKSDLPTSLSTLRERAFALAADVLGLSADAAHDHFCRLAGVDSLENISRLAWPALFTHLHGVAQQTKARADAARKRDLARIHQAKKALNIDDDDYRAILQRVTGKTSAADLSARQRAAVIAEFRRFGWKPATAKRHGRKPTVAEGGEALLNKLAALLADANRPWSYLDTMAKTMFGVDSIQFCRQAQLRKIVAALSIDQRRRTGQVYRP